MPDKQVLSEIREAVVAQCDLYQLPAPWDFLAPHDDVRSLPAEPVLLLASLREKYPDDALIRAGVAQVDARPATSRHPPTGGYAPNAD